MDRNELLDRPLPHSKDAERVTLGAAILDNSLMDALVRYLVAEDYYIRAHQFIFRAMKRLHERGSEIDYILIGEELKLDGMLEQVGGVFFVFELTDGIPHGARIASYAKIIKEKSLRRQLAKLGSKLSAEALDEDETPAEELASKYESVLYDMKPRTSRSAGPLSYKEIWEKWKVRQWKMQNGQLGAIPYFNLPELSELCNGGLADSELHGIAALPKMGKSASMKQCADFNGARHIGCLVFSREMEDVSIMQRSLAAQTYRDAGYNEEGIPASHLRRAYALDEARKSRVMQAGQLLAGWPVWVETGTSNIAEIAAITRNWITRTYREWLKTHHPDEWELWAPYFIIMVDYVQLLRGNKVRYGTQAEEFKDIWRSLRDMTLDLGARILAIAQFNREAYKAGRPHFSQIEGSGEAEKAVNVGMVLWTEPSQMEEVQRKGSIFVDYQREGPPGKVDVIFDTHSLEFYSPNQQMGLEAQR